MMRSKFEMCPSSPSDRRMYSKPLACRPRCWRGRFEKSWAGIGGHRGSSHSHTSGGVGVRRLLALREPRERPDLHQRLLRPERAEAVGRGAAVHRQHEVVREAVEQRVVEPLPVELVEVGHVGAAVAVPAHHRVVERAVPGRHRQRRVGRAARCRAGPRRSRTSLACTIPAMPSLIVPQVLDVGVDERAAGRTAGRRAAGNRVRDHQLRVRLHHVVLLDERFIGELPVHREPARVPPLGAQRLHLPGVEDGGERLEALAQRRRVVVEVDPRAPAPRPRTAPATRSMSSGLQVVLGERPPLGDEGVRAVEAVAPAVERAD